MYEINMAVKQINQNSIVYNLAHYRIFNANEISNFKNRIKLLK